MVDIPRDKFCEIVAADSGVANDARRCKGLLLDYLGSQYRKEIRALLAALDEHVPEDLRARYNHEPPLILLARLTQRLMDDCGLEATLARWAVGTWTVALGFALWKACPLPRRRRIPCLRY